MSICLFLESEVLKWQVNVFDKNIEEAEDILNIALDNYESNLKETRILLKPDFRNSIVNYI